MNTIHVSELKEGMHFRNLYGEHYGTIEIVNAEKGMVKSENPYWGYTSQLYWFALDKIQVFHEGVWCFVNENQTAG